MTPLPLPFGLGLVEGFYGRCWDPADRLAMIDFLASCDYRYYLYAPKADSVLRRHWRDRWEPEQEATIRGLADRCRARGMRWGLGLSPLGLAEALDGDSLRALRRKLDYLAGFSPDILAILFDDMPRGVDDLAERQVAIVDAVASAGIAPHLLVCPSYYSSDPVLERVFGSMPTGYWDTLAAQLPPAIGLFWTGEKVCADAQDPLALAALGERWRRRPLLWDNYPVNDGARMSRFLHIAAFRDRPAGLAGVVQAHFANPMNQCWLSRLPLATLAMSYAQGADYDPARAFAAALGRCCEPALAACLLEDLDAVQVRGLDGLDAEGRARIDRRYAGFDSPLARELREWLAGGYAFDPACLTD